MLWQTLMRLMTQCNEKGFELEVSIYATYRMFGECCFNPWTCYNSSVSIFHSYETFWWNDWNIMKQDISILSFDWNNLWLLLQIKSADNRILQEQLQNKVRIPLPVFFILWKKSICFHFILIYCGFIFLCLEMLLAT